MSRLLFAAARGARIQTDYRDCWIAAAYIPAGDYAEYYFRIHPDDEHRQYGPISTALRNDALGLPLTETCWFRHLALHSDGDLNTIITPSERSIFLLLMAEALADEGL